MEVSGVGGALEVALPTPLGELAGACSPSPAPTPPLSQFQAPVSREERVGCKLSSLPPSSRTPFSSKIPSAPLSVQPSDYTGCRVILPL